ncbi:primosomal protein N' [Dongia sedimenti]|uniref:Replication restart protein PriA n=1 Tax=Dongia sedimenti TaxID=3064282 RepID=A0ABU0YNZ5_9PROT|nr:primosomal protein N' [Rhodospirillaceae bacterium R-7]
MSVLIPLALFTAYDYAVPEGLPLAPGDFVAVPLGRRTVMGVVWGDGDDSVPAAKLRAVEARLELPAMPEVSRRFIDWVANYCMAPIGSVLRMAMSVPEALEPEKPIKAWQLGDAESGKMTAVRQRVLTALENGPPLTSGDLARAASCTAGVVAEMARLGMLRAVALPARRPFGRPDADRPGPTLSEAQRAAVDALAPLTPGVTLLNGVTGSGKTEVYFEAIASCLRAGRQALVMLPEIALSAQWLGRFEERFGAAPAQWHSELTQAERRVTWRAVLDGEAKVVVGARSALFLPFADLGLIIVDEEHEPAFKQEDGVIYQARDMAVVRGHLAKIPVVLASATPSLESIVNTDQGRYRLLELPDRHGGAELPAVTLIDLRRDKPERQQWLSPSLIRAVNETLADQGQAILFLNRRGYAPLTLCRDCGHRMQCPNCTTWLVEHRYSARLQCHHCGYQIQMPKACPACQHEGTFAACGPGVERLAEEAALLFPNARRMVLTSDTVGGPKKATELIRMITEREVDLIIGTQIIAKGHHFPHLTLVGVVDADLGLSGGDLRAAERTYQLLHQVAGRAGRAERSGRVLIQTYDPARPVMEALKDHDQARFLKIEEEDRRQAGMPPFGRLAALIISGSDDGAVEKQVRMMAAHAPRVDGVSVLGPAPAPLAMLRGRHRRRFLVKCRRDVAPQGFIRQWLRGLKWPGDLRLQIDIDPYSFL